MCAFYDDEQKIKKGDLAIYQNQNITITKATHIKHNKTMDIIYIFNDDKNEIEQKINIPYKTTINEFNLFSRKVS